MGIFLPSRHFVLFPRIAVGCALMVATVAADTLTPQQVVGLALEKNFAISLARDQTAQAGVDRQSALGAFLPSASATATNEGTLTDSVGQITTVGASVNWQIFDGLQSVHAYQRLKSAEESAQLQERLAIESTLESVLEGYYNVVLQNQLLAALQELTGVAEDQAKLAQAKAEVGSGANLDALQAVATLQEDSSSLLAQRITLREAKVQLNQLLARDPALDFEVLDTIPIASDLPLKKWRAALPDQNATILEAKAQRDVSDYSLQTARGLWWPSLNAGLGYSQAPAFVNASSVRNDAEVNYQIAVSVPIFSQFQHRQAVVDAKFQLHESQTSLLQAESNIDGEFVQDAEKYRAGLDQVSLAARNMHVAELQADAAYARYKAGTGTALDFRDAQSILLQAKSQLITSRQNTKQAELALKRLAGILVQATPAMPEGR